jgi:hypothetical protein
LILTRNRKGGSSFVAVFELMQKRACKTATSFL